MSRTDLASDIMRAANIMRSDDGTTGIYEYIEQISWMSFFKVYEDLEERFESEHQLDGKQYERVIPKEFSWSEWTRTNWKKQKSF